MPKNRTVALVVRIQPETAVLLRAHCAALNLFQADVLEEALLSTLPYKAGQYPGSTLDASTPAGRWYKTLEDAVDREAIVRKP